MLGGLLMLAVTGPALEYLGVSPTLAGIAMFSSLGAPSSSQQRGGNANWNDRMAITSVSPLMSALQARSLTANVSGRARDASNVATIYRPVLWIFIF
jgi:hypothetical protein